MDTQDKNWPAWRYGPDGASDVFQSEGDVPAGWQDHPSKVITPAKTGSAPLAPRTDVIPAAQRGAAPVVAQNDASAGQTGGKPAGTATEDVSNTLDADGWPWDAKMHAGTQAKTQAGLWRMKVGAKRPAPKPGFPKPVLDL